MPSSLDLIQGQPIRFGFTEETCANNDNKAYCNLVQDGDRVSFQLRRTRGTEIGCSLTGTSATNVILNGTFTGSATGWTLGGGWSYAGNAISITAGSGTASGGSVGFVDKALYKIEITTLITTTGDDLDVTFCGTSVGFIPVDSLAGTYTFYGVCDIGTPTITVAGTSITTRIDSVLAYRAAECLTFEVLEGTLSYDADAGLTISGTVTITVDLTFEPSAWYSPKTTLSFANVQAGNIAFSFDTDTSPTLPISNGDMAYTMNAATDTTLGISLEDFVGNITEISFEQMSSDYSFGLYDLDGEFVQSLNSFVSYCRDFLMCTFSPQDEGFAYGCYKIGLYDPYLHEDHIEYEYDFTTLGVPWTETGATWTLDAAGYTFDSAAGGAATISTSETAPSSYYLAWAKARFETGEIDGAGSVTFQAEDPNTTGIIGVGGVVADDTIYQTSAEGSPSVLMTTDVDITFFLAGTSAADSYTIENAYLKIYPYHLDYLSNCFSYQESFDCTKLIYALPGENIGFNTTCDFEIHQRFRVLRITPEYNVDASDFIGSDSTRTLISGTGQKFYTLYFDYMGEVGHDMIMTFMLSKFVYIGDQYTGIVTSGKRYFVLPQRYIPEWDKNGKMNLAMGRILIMEQDQVRLTTNCGN